MTKPKRKPGRHRRTDSLGPVGLAVMVATWSQTAITAHIHALMGGDSDALVNGAGRVFYVVLGAAMAAKLDADHPDLRILRGAVEALHEQAEELEIQQNRRLAIASGLNACKRLTPKFTQRQLADAAVSLEIKLRRGDVRYSDFLALVETE